MAVPIRLSAYRLIKSATRVHTAMPARLRRRATPTTALLSQMTGIPPDCTLRDQIIAANTDEPAGSCPAGDGADTITLQRQHFACEKPLPSITGDITIDGKGSYD